MNKLKALLKLVECEMQRFQDPLWSDSADHIGNDISTILEIGSMITSDDVTKSDLRKHLDTLDTELRDRIRCFVRNYDNVYQAMYECGYIVISDTKEKIWTK